MRQDQKGFSLVELIVVIAIMAIVTTVGLTSFSLVTGQQVKSCTANIEGYIGQTRMQALSRDSGSLMLEVLDNGVFATLSSGENVKVGSSGITISYSSDDGSEVTLGEGDTLSLSFDRSSGAFSPLAETGAYCTEIRVQGSGRLMRIVLIPRTGKFYVENAGGGG